MLSPIPAKLHQLAHKLKRSWVKHRIVEPMLASIPRDAVILEIGGSFNPRYTKPGHPNVYHLDHCSAEELREKYAPMVGDTRHGLSQEPLIYLKWHIAAPPSHLANMSDGSAIASLGLDAAAGGVARLVADLEPRQVCWAGPRASISCKRSTNRGLAQDVG